MRESAQVQSFRGSSTVVSRLELETVRLALVPVATATTELASTVAEASWSLKVFEALAPRSWRTVRSEG